jgi:hypothetical protein
LAVINATREFEGWIEALSHREQKSVLQVVKILEQVGIALGEPYSSALEGANYPLRELRPKRGRSPLRIIYAFDPKREALLLLGGDKGADKRFYERALPRAERLWEEHLEDLEREGQR